MGLLIVDDQLERRPVAILQTAHLMGSFRRNPLGGVQIPLLPLMFGITTVYDFSPKAYVLELCLRRRYGMSMRRPLALLLFAILMGPVTGSLTVSDFDGRTAWSSIDSNGVQWIHSGQTFDVPIQTIPEWVGEETPWWERTALDLDRNEIHDSI